MSSVFEKMFGRSRSEVQQKETRSWTEILSAGVKPHMPYFKSAIDYGRAGQLQLALQNIEQAIRLADRRNWKLHAFKANILEDLKRHDSAIKEYELAIEYDGGDVNRYAQYHQIGYNYLQLGNNLKAESFYSAALELKDLKQGEDLEGMEYGILLGVPKKRIFNNRANVLKNLGRLQEAFNDCKSAIAIDPNYSNPYLMASQIFAKANQEDAAIKYLKQASRLGNTTALSMVRELGL